MTTTDFDRCEYGHKVCTACGGCVCDGGSRVSTDKRGRTLCAACRWVWRGTDDEPSSGAASGVQACSFDALSIY